MHLDSSWHLLDRLWNVRGFWLCHLGFRSDRSRLLLLLLLLLQLA